RAATISGAEGRVLVLTDGVATAGEGELSELVAAARALERVGVVRIDALLDGGLHNREALQAVATAGLQRDGIVADADLDAAVLADKLLRTTLSDIQVSVEG